MVVTKVGVVADLEKKQSLDEGGIEGHDPLEVVLLQIQVLELLEVSDELGDGAIELIGAQIDVSKKRHCRKGLGYRAG